MTVEDTSRIDQEAPAAQCPVSPQLPIPMGSLAN